MLYIVSVDCGKRPIYAKCRNAKISYIKNITFFIAVFFFVSSF